MEKTKLKTVTYDAIETIMKWALFDKGTITSLEIKNYLRTKGYFATQEIVRDLMEEVFIYNVSCSFEFSDEIYHTINFRIINKDDVSYKEYYLELENEEDEETPDSECLSCEDLKVCFPSAGKSNVAPAPTIAPVVSTTTPANTAAAINDPRGYIAKNMDVSSYLLSKVLGISVASVAAYKANINR